MIAPDKKPERLENLDDEATAYYLAKRQALALLEQGFRLSSQIRASRDELHER